VGVARLAFGVALLPDDVLRRAVAADRRDAAGADGICTWTGYIFVYRGAPGPGAPIRLLIADDHPVVRGAGRGPR